MILEACVGNLQDAISAQKKGAHQIELCDRLDLDGNNPPVDLVREVTNCLSIPVKVIVNPKPFDYQYSPIELDEIEKYISAISNYNIEGIVFGPVDPDGMPDLKAITRISQCTNLPITYHKAIDASPELLKATQLLADQNIVQYILTSGGAKTAKQGINNLLSMKDVLMKSKSNIKLIAAGSITDVNLDELNDTLNFAHYHGKLIVGQL